jgi:hypothetical protein
MHYELHIRRTGNNPPRGPSAGQPDGLGVSALGATLIDRMGDQKCIKLKTQTQNTLFSLGMLTYTYERQDIIQINYPELHSSEGTLSCWLHLQSLAHIRTGPAGYGPFSSIV